VTDCGKNRKVLVERVSSGVYRNGKPIGLSREWYGKDRPKQFTHYNNHGKEEGLMQQWWPNGNLKAELIAKAGQYTEGTEYFPTGKPRLVSKDRFYPTRTPSFKEGHIYQKTFLPDGRVIGEMKNGTGEVYMISAEPDSLESKSDKLHNAKGSYPAFLESYKDGKLLKVRQLDTAQSAKLLRDGVR